MFESDAMRFTVTPKANEDPEALPVTDYAVTQALEGAQPVPILIRREDYDILYELTSELPCVDPPLKDGDTCTTSATLNSEFIVADHITDLVEEMDAAGIQEQFVTGFEHFRTVCAAWTREVAETEESEWSFTVMNTNGYIGTQYK